MADGANGAHTCPDCHALVAAADLEAHRHWHVELVRHISRAVKEAMGR